MLDYLGKTLSIGDPVVLITPKYRDFSQAIVVGFTKDYVKLEFTVTNSSIYDIGSPLKQKSNQLIKVALGDL